MRAMWLMLAGLVLVAGTLPAPAQAPRAPTGWSKIAAQPTQGRQGVAVFDVASAPGQWRALRLEVKSGDLAVTRIEIQYAGGGRYTETRHIALLEGERTRPLDPGTDRFVDRVSVTYQAETEGKAPATLEVWGLRSATGADIRRGAETPLVAAPPKGPDSREVLIGIQRAGYRSDRDAFEVGEVGRFTRLKLKVHDNEIHVERGLVFYADGETETVAMDGRVAAGGVSPWIAVKADRFIRRVEFVTRSRPSFRGQARIELVGELAEGWLGPTGPGREFNGGWVLLGAQTAGFIGFDRDLIPIGGNEGGFRNLRVTVRDRAVSFDELRVVYAAGGAQIIQVGRRVNAGQTFGPVALDPARPIREIRVRYRSRYFDRQATAWRPAIVEVWGQH
ncbi:MAG: DUF2541 domain-containing protein [Hyphomicrobiaceae bacterium]